MHAASVNVCEHVHALRIIAEIMIRERFEQKTNHRMHGRSEQQATILALVDHNFKQVVSER